MANIATVVLLLFCSTVFAGAFSDLEDELDELNRQNKGYQSLLDDLDATDSGSSSSNAGKVRIREMDSNDVSPKGSKPKKTKYRKANQKKTNTSTTKKKIPKRKKPVKSGTNIYTFGNGQGTIKEVVPGVFKIRCNGNFGWFNAGNILKGRDAKAAVKKYIAAVNSHIKSVCNVGSGSKHKSSSWLQGMVNKILLESGNWVRKKHYECLQKNRKNPHLCGGYKGRIPITGVRG